MKFFLLITTGLCVFASAAALSCYICHEETCKDDEAIECNSITGAVGATLVASMKPGIQVITSSNFKCFKLVVETPTKETITAKGCVYDTMAVCEGTPLLVTQKECAMCTEDACNGATNNRRLATGFGLLLALAALVWGTQH